MPGAFSPFVRNLVQKDDGPAQGPSWATQQELFSKGGVGGKGGAKKELDMVAHTYNFALGGLGQGDCPEF